MDDNCICKMGPTAVFFILYAIITIVLWIIIVNGKRRHRKRTAAEYVGYHREKELVAKTNLLHSAMCLNMFAYSLIPFYGIVKIIECYSNYMHSEDADRFLDRYSKYKCKPIIKL